METNPPSPDGKAGTGRYGWVGGTGTAAYVVPSTGAVSILLTQVALDGPVPPALLRDFCVHAAGA